jgi:hypothetical protein
MTTKTSKEKKSEKIKEHNDLASLSIQKNGAVSYLSFLARLLLIQD